MCVSQRENDVLNFLRHGMETVSQRQTLTMLGNRNDYIGMSDLAKYVECPRAALAGKINDKDGSLEQLLIFARGHWIEDGIGQSLGSCGYPIMRQLEISTHMNHAPLKSHLDFVLFTAMPEPKVRIVEVKSMSVMPDSPYAQHQFQAQGQVTLLQEFWNQPVFTLRDDNGNAVFEGATFPEICKANFGVVMPVEQNQVSIEAWLMCISMKEARAFGPYSHSDETVSDLAFLADDFWKLFVQLKDNPEDLISVPYMREYNPFCCVCRYNFDCPKFCNGDDQPQWDAAIAKLQSLKEQKAACEAEIRELDAAIRQAYLLSGTKDWITAGRYRFRVAQMPGRKSFNKEALKDELAGIFTDRNIDMDVPALIANCERQGASYSTLRIMPNVA